MVGWYLMRLVQTLSCVYLCCLIRGLACHDGRDGLHPDGRPLVVWAGCHRAVGWGAHRRLPLQQLEDSLDVRRHLRFQPGNTTTIQYRV